MTVGRNFLIYLFSSLLAGLLPLLLIPFLTRQLEPEEYGVMITLTTLVMVTLPIINFGIIPYLGVQYFRIKRAQFVDILVSLLVVPIAITLMLVAVYALSAPWVAGLFDVPIVWIPIVSVMAASYFIPMVTLNLLRMRDQPFGYAALELSNATLNFAMTILLIFGLGLAWEGRLIAAFGVNALISTAAFIWLQRRGFLAGTFTSSLLPPAVRFGAGVLPHDLANQAMRLADRLIIAVMIGQTALGAYGVATQIASVMLVMLGALNRAWTPFVFSTLKEDTEEARLRLVRRSYQVYIGLVFFFVAFNLVLPWVYDSFVDERYHDGAPATFWLTLGYLFNGFYLTVVDRIFYLKKTHILAAVTVLNAVGSLSLSIALAQGVGAVGVPIAFAATSGVVMVCVFALTQRLAPLPWFRALKQ